MVIILRICAILPMYNGDNLAYLPCTGAGLVLGQLSQEEAILALPPQGSSFLRVKKRHFLSL